MNKKTVVLGATNNPSRYAYLAINSLKRYGHEIVPVGIKTGEVQGLEILDLRQKPSISDVDTITLYIGPQNQVEWYDYIISLKPKRIIFNPGTENMELIKRAKDAGIEPVMACTLVMLSLNDY